MFSISSAKRLLVLRQTAWKLYQRSLCSKQVSICFELTIWLIKLLNCEYQNLVIKKIKMHLIRSERQAQIGLISQVVVFGHTTVAQPT